MRYFCYHEYTEDNEPWIKVMSEEDIRKEYFPWWEKKMIDKYGEEHYNEHYSFLDCVDDWITTNYAWESKS